jgi:hypothetical protein
VKSVAAASRRSQIKAVFPFPKQHIGMADDVASFKRALSYEYGI